jgi:anthranilate synthase component I
VTPPICPTREEFVAQAEAGYTVVPVWTEVLADLETPVSAFSKLVGRQPGFLLESVEGGERWARYSFIGRHPALVMVARPGRIEWEGIPPSAAGDQGDPLLALRALLQHFRAPHASLPPLFAGLVGWLGYDVVRYVERLPATNPDDLDVPEALIMLAGSLAIFDHLRQQLIIVENSLIEPGTDPGAAYDSARDQVLAAVEALAKHLAYEPAPVALDVPVPPFRSNFTSEEYQAVVRAAKEYIYAGDAFQIVPSQRFSIRLETDPLDVYRALRLLNPSAYMFYIHHGEATVLGASPETMVRLRDRTVTSRPIAGTKPRGSTPEEDRALAEELLNDPKERAEHVMLVDLARNDVGRVAEFGTEGVEDFMVIERYSHVMHIVSSVSARVREGLDAIDVLRATFPHGTVSGAPKVRAMEIIEELEPVRRGVYSGLVGYIDFAGNMDTCIALRTMVVKDGIAYIQAGGGVVADSDPASEDEECHQKARALLSAVAAVMHRRSGEAEPAGAL